MSLYTVKPITDFTIFTTPSSRRVNSRFDSPWSTTVNELQRELEHLDATNVVFEIGVTPRDIRLDGMLRADARPSHPGVRVSFQSKHGPLSYTCDNYECWYSWQGPAWQHNVRAIVKTLEALRAIDRYGATKGEQYAGFKELPSGSGATPMGGMTKSDAVTLLDELYGSDEWQKVEGGSAAAFKRAKASAHPDRNDGDRMLWDKVEQAGKVLGLA